VLVENGGLKFQEKTQQQIVVVVVFFFFGYILLNEMIFCLQQNSRVRERVVVLREFLLEKSVRTLELLPIFTKEKLNCSSVVDSLAGSM